MSTSCGTPSNKIKWYRSMCDKLKYEERLQELATKSVTSTYQVTTPMSKKNHKKFEQFVNQAKIDKEKHQRKNKKEKSHD